MRLALLTHVSSSSLCGILHPGTRLMFLKVKVKSLSYVRLFSTTWTIAYQAPLSMGFSRQ